MASIVRPFCSNPATNVLRFPNTEYAGITGPGAGLSYWSATPNSAGLGSWYVDFVEGEVGPSPITTSKAVRLVRTAP